MISCFNSFAQFVKSGAPFSTFRDAPHPEITNTIVPFPYLMETSQVSKDSKVSATLSSTLTFDSLLVIVVPIRAFLTIVYFSSTLCS